MFVRALEFEDAADFVETEPKTLGLTDERKNGEIVSGVCSVSGVVSLWNSEQAAESVKGFETSFFYLFCMRAASGSLIQATVGSLGGVGRPANRAGLAA